MDDCLFSKPTVEQVIQSALALIQILRKGNFRLTKFVSNAKTALAAISAKERTFKNIDLDNFLIERALGLQGNMKLTHLESRYRYCQSFLNMTQGEDVCRH